MEQEKKATWLELLYDLAFAALVAQLTYSVAQHHSSITDIMSTILVGYAIFIAWLGTTVNRNLRDSESRLDKLIVQVQILGGLGMSMSLPKVFEGDPTAFCLTFVFVKVIQILVSYAFIIKNPDQAPKTNNVMQGRIIATVLWTIAAFVMMPYFYVVAFMALLVDLLAPLTKGKGNSITYLNVSHLQERLGLFLIMVIGESVLIVSLTNTVVQYGIKEPIVVLAGVISMLALWWAYFNHLERCALGKRPQNMFLYINAHGVLYGGVVLFAAAFKNILKHEHLLLSDLLLLVFGVLAIGASLIAIRVTLKASKKQMTTAMLAMVLGIPAIGYLGYLSHSASITTVIVTLWIVTWVVYDEWTRAPFFRK
jgi:low temperature requirement protein LtrA